MSRCAETFKLNQTRALDEIFASACWQPDSDNSVSIDSTGTGLASPYPIADIASAVMSAVAHGVTEIHSRRTGVTQQARISRGHASLAMATNEYLRVNGKILGSWDPLTRYFRSADQQWIYLHTAFSHLRNATLKHLNVDNDQPAVEKAIAKIQADEFESSAIKKGLTVARLRTRQQWQDHAQFDSLNQQPLLKISRIDESPAQPLPEYSSFPARPLQGLRVLDFSRVIAGPMAGRSLAEHGATVLRVASPKLPFIEGLVIDTGAGKHSCHLDLTRHEDNVAMKKLISETDVVINAYRPGSLDKFDLSVADLVRQRPGIICASISAFSEHGPWAGRRGYDTLVQATTGLAQDYGEEQPRRLPCQPLDYICGYLSSFGIMVAMLKREQSGGSWHVEMSLARTANWLWEMFDAMHAEPAPPLTNISFEQAREMDFIVRNNSSYGTLQSLAPVIAFSKTPAAYSRSVVPLGSDPAEWPEKEHKT